MPLLNRKSQVTGRIQTDESTAIALTGANDGKTRHIVGAGAEYDAPRTKRDIARSSLSPLGNLESTKAVGVNFSAEVNTPDTFSKSLSSLDIESIQFQSAPSAGGSIQRITFNGSPDLSDVVAGDYITCLYCDNASNDGDFQITNVDDGSDFVDVFNPNRTDDTDDEDSLSEGIGDIQTKLEYGWAIRSAGAEIRGLTRLAIGAVTSGPFTRNETVTGGTSSGTARVVIPAENGDSHIYVVPLTGKLQTSEVLTGGTSGATATSSSGPVVYGYYVKPVSDNQEVATVSYKEDGYEWKARSAATNISAEFQANMAGRFDFTCKGPKSSIGDSALDTVSRGDEDPPVLKDAELTLDSFTPVFATVSFETGNQIALRQNGNATDGTGFEAARITSREPKVTLTLEHALASVFDFFAKLDAGTKTALKFKLGSTAAKQFWFFSDYLEFDALPLGDQEGIRSLEISALCTGQASSSEDEWEMVFLGN